MTWFLLPLIGGYIVAQRRATFGSLGLALLVVVILGTQRQRIQFLKLVLPVALLVGIYLGIFWNSDSGIALPAQLVKASFFNDREDAGEKYYSNLYRVQERYNLAVTIRGAAAAGIGFGKTYQNPVKLAKISFPLWEYIPHNEILWLLVKMGAVGFALFWWFFDGLIVKAASVFMRLDDPYLKAVALVVIAAIFNQVFVSYFDLQLTFHRNMVYLGTLTGLLPALASYAGGPAIGQGGKP